MDINLEEPPHQTSTPLKLSHLTDRNNASIVSMIDHQIELEKSNLLKQMILQEERQEKIEKIASELRNDIKNLEKIIQKVLNKQHKEYLKSFMTFMDSVRKGLLSKLEHMDKIQEEKDRVNDSNILKCERDFFRSYSIKLNNDNKELTSKIEDMMIKTKILSEEVMSVTLKWRECEKENKRMINELESSICENNDLHKRMLFTKFNQDISTLYNNNSTIIQRKKEEDSYNLGLGSSLNNNSKAFVVIEKLKMRLKREQLRNQKSESEVCSILLEKHQLENIFLNCIEETRKCIENRRIKAAMATKYKKEPSSLPMNNNTPISHNKYETFLPGDKREILEKFVFNKDVFNLIRDALFPKSSINADVNIKVDSNENSKRHSPLNLRNTHLIESTNYFSPLSSTNRFLGNRIRIIDHVKTPSGNNTTNRTKNDLKPLNQSRSLNVLLTNHFRKDK